MYEVGAWIAGKYRVEHLLGRGGMAIVVAAEHAELRARVALKLLEPALAQRADVVERFLREARVSAQLRSEHACRVTELGRLETGAPYMVMEMLDGRDLANVIATDGPLPFATAAAYVIQACDAIAEAHAAQIVHRDLKPANLFLTQRRDGEPLIKVLDFGIAKVADADDHAVTAIDEPGCARRGSAAGWQRGVVDDLLGSPSYMAPEQHGSAALADARSDVWSLGIILYELVSGRRPFTGSSPVEIALQVANEAPPPLTNVPAGFAAAIARCLDKQPRRRFQRVVDLVAALRPFTPRETPREVTPSSLKVERAIALGSNARIAVPPGWRPPHPQALPIPLPLSPERAARPSTHPPLPPGMRLPPPLPVAAASAPVSAPARRLAPLPAALGFLLLVVIGLLLGLYLGSDGLTPPRAPAADRR